MAWSRTDGTLSSRQRFSHDRMDSRRQASRTHAHPWHATLHVLHVSFWLAPSLPLVSDTSDATPSSRTSLSGTCSNHCCVSRHTPVTLNLRSHPTVSRSPTQRTRTPHPPGRPRSPHGDLFAPRHVLRTARRATKSLACLLPRYM